MNKTHKQEEITDSSRSTYDKYRNVFTHLIDSSDNDSSSSPQRNAKDLNFYKDYRSFHITNGSKPNNVVPYKDNQALKTESSYNNKVYESVHEPTIRIKNLNIDMQQFFKSP